HPDFPHAATARYLLNVARDLGARTGDPWHSLPLLMLAAGGAILFVRRDPGVGVMLLLPPVLLIAAGAAWPPLRQTRFLPIVGPQLALLLIGGTWAILDRAAGARRTVSITLGVAGMSYCAFGLINIYRLPVQAIREAVRDTGDSNQRTAAV